jgi:hypothetical protein
MSAPIGPGNLFPPSFPPSAKPAPQSEGWSVSRTIREQLDSAHKGIDGAVQSSHDELQKMRRHINQTFSETSQAKSLAYAWATGVEHGAGAGFRLTKALEVPIGIATGAALASTAGPAFGFIFNCLGGATMGRAVDRIGTDMLHKDQSKEARDKSYTESKGTAGFLGGVATGVFGLFNPVAGAIGAYRFGKGLGVVVTAVVAAGIGGIVGGAVGAVNYLAHKSAPAAAPSPPPAEANPFQAAQYNFSGVPPQPHPSYPPSQPVS